MQTETIKVGVGRGAKRSDGNYGSDEYFFYSETALPATATADDKLRAMDDLVNEVNAMLTAETEGAEVIQLPAAVSVAAPAAAVAPASAPAPAPAPALAAEAVAASVGGAIVVPDNPAAYSGSEKEWAIDRVNYLLANEPHKVSPKFNPDLEWWDNRDTPENPKRNPKMPDFKHKDNSDWVVWPPR